MTTRLYLYLMLAIHGLFASINASDTFFEEKQVFIEEGDLQDKCKALVLQKLLQQRVEAAPLLADQVEHLSHFHAQIEVIKAEGFSDDEFKRVKQQLTDQIEAYALSKTTLENPLSIDFDEALSISSVLYQVEKMQLADLAAPLSAFLKDEPRTFRMIYPEPSSSAFAKERDWTHDTSTTDLSIRFGDNPIDHGVEYFLQNVTSTHIESFYQLPLEEKDQKLIYELIKTIAEKNVFGLLFKKKEVEKLGKKVNHVHPMRFMGYILSEPKLRKWLKDIRNSSFKWDYFMREYGERMKEENAKNNIMPYAAGMAHLLHVEQNHILGYLQAKDYTGMVKSFL
jgi:hypothetical protein